MKVFWIIFVLFISGCSTSQPSSVDETDRTQYRNAIIDAAVIEDNEIIPLPVIRKDQKRIRVVTWTKYPDSYPVGKMASLHWGEVWVTLDKDIQKRCQNFNKETLSSDIKKLIGLPLDNNQKRSFVVLEVDADSLFRPCANPSLQAETCSSEFPKDISDEHIFWYARHVALSYKEKDGYPWTRLGYTYNWKSNANEIGVTEFVLRKDSKVKAVSNEGTISYCEK